MHVHGAWVTEAEAMGSTLLPHSRASRVACRRLSYVRSSNVWRCRRLLVSIDWDMDQCSGEAR